jgi:hypothetical protein
MPLRMSRKFATVIAISAAIALASCSNPGNSVSNKPLGNVPAPQVSSVKPVTHPVEAPKSFVKLNCDSLVATSVIDAGIAEPVALLPVVTDQFSLLTDGFPSTDEPGTFALTQIKGISCEWSNGKPAVLEGATNPEFAGVVISILPNAATEWASFQSTSPDSQLTDSCYFDSYLKGTSCVINTLHNGSWYDVQIDGLDVPSGASAAVQKHAAHLILDAATNAVDAAAADASSWVTATGTIPLATNDCSQFLTETQASNAAGFGIVNHVEAVDPAVKISSVSAGAWKRANLDECSWTKAVDPDELYSSEFILEWLPGGEWAWNEIKAAGLPGNAKPLAVPGLKTGESAYIQCGTYGDECQVDLIVGHNWIWLYSYPYLDGAPPFSEAAATGLAADIVANLH